MGTREGRDLATYDVVVVGGGTAGLSGALTLGRARRSVVVVDAGEPRNSRASGVHGFLTPDGTNPTALLRAGRAEVRRYGVRVLEGPRTRPSPSRGRLRRGVGGRTPG
jgi:thioredoxin reductase